MPLTVRDNHRFISIIEVSGGFLGTVMDNHRHISITGVSGGFLAHSQPYMYQYVVSCL